jgi:hypothetical protein
MGWSRMKGCGCDARSLRIVASKPNCLPVCAACNIDPLQNPDLVAPTLKTRWLTAG